MNVADVADRLEAYIRTQFSVDTGDQRFSRAIDLFELGYLDSIGFAELLDFVQQEYAVEVPESDLLSDEFSSIDGIARIVARL